MDIIENSILVFPRFRISIILLACLSVVIHYIFRTSHIEIECQHLFHSVIHEVCEEFQSHEVVGEFCNNLCPTKIHHSYIADQNIHVSRNGKPDIRLMTCPDMGMHSGKEFVVAVKFTDKALIMKGKKSSIRSIMLDLPGLQETCHQRPADSYASLVYGSLIDFGLKEQDPSHVIPQLVPWSEPDGLEMNLSSWRTLSLLSQDPEFIIARLMQQDRQDQEDKRHQLFPSIISSCGHLYVTEFADAVLDSSFIIPSIVPWISRSKKEKIDVGVKLLRLLIEFVRQAPDRDMCDVKLHQFASFSSSKQLLLIDSDMIYSADFVRKSLGAVHSCKSNQECDFFDCKGLCLHVREDSGDNERRRAMCIPDHQDNNLRRICRNILFPFAFDLLGTRVRLFGLFADHYTNFRQEISEIGHLCESSSRETMLQNAYEILQIMEKIRMNI